MKDTITKNRPNIVKPRDPEPEGVELLFFTCKTGNEQTLDVGPGVATIPLIDCNYEVKNNLPPETSWRINGQSEEYQRILFSSPANKADFRETCKYVGVEVNRLAKAGYKKVAVIFHCRHGVSKSVAIAIRVARWASHWEMIDKVHIKHQDLAEQWAIIQRRPNNPKNKK